MGGLLGNRQGGWPGGWVDGWLEKMKIEQSSVSAGLKIAELDNNIMSIPLILVLILQERG